MIGLASALLLLLPIGVMAMPDGGDEAPDDGGGAHGYQEVTAMVYDVVLAQMPRERVYDPDSLRGEERLVEGHTVFLVLELESMVVDANGSVDIMGMVDCDVRARYSGPTFFGIPLPERVDEAGATCRVDEHVVVTPDPFANPPAGQAAPTGRLIPFPAPTGGVAYAEELGYPVVLHDEDGASRTVTFYAWKVPVWQPWMDPQGRPKNFYAPLPEDRLREMGVQDFEVYHEKDWARFG